MAGEFFVKDGKRSNPDGSPIKVDSTSPKRTDDAISGNVMRHKYRVLSIEEQHHMRMVKDLGATFYDFVDKIGNTRELSLAKTKIEEAVMWAVKHITG